MGGMGRKAGEVAYAVVVAGCALLGALREDPRFYLAGIALALPVGAVAFVAIYAGYALLAGVVGLFADTELPGGGTPGWLTTSSAVLNVLLISAAAIANVLLVRRLRRRRPRTDGQSG